MGIALEVIPMGQVSAFGRSWTSRGRRLVTAIVKATYRVTAEGALVPMEPQPIAREERHYRNNPVASLMRGSDLALVVAKPEILVVGSAYAAPGQTTPQTTVRLSLMREQQMLINKRLNVFGDRRAAPGDPAPAAAPFSEMPVLYERAKGGIASRENPVGVGMATDGDGLLTLPNVEQATQGAPGPAGFGPIPSAWPLRQKKRGSMSWSDANFTQDVAVPDDFDDAYYQTAPVDQQTAGIYPGDVIAIVNMHPELGNLRFTIPALRGSALAQSAKGTRYPFTLRIDTVHVEPSELVVEIVYRGAIVVQDAGVERLRIAAALEDPRSPHVYPDLSTLAGLVALGQEDAGRRNHASTMLIDPEPTRPLGQSLHQPAAPAAPPPPAAGPARGFSGTMVMEPDPPPGASKPKTLPAPEAEAHKFGGTMVIEAEVAPQSLPFRRVATEGGPVRADPTEIGATPWDGGPKRSVEEASHDLSSTMAVESTLAIEDPGTVDLQVGEDLVPPPASAPAPPAVARKKGPYRDDDLADEPTTEARPKAPVAPPEPPKPPRKDVVANLYKKAKR